MGAQRVIGVDVGGTKTLAGVVGRDGEVGRTAERATPSDSQEELLAALDDVVDEVRADGEIDAVGFGLPSTIDQNAGTAVSSVHIPLAGLAFRSRMSERYAVPVAMDNDGNAAAIAEWQLGAGRGTRHMIMLTLGTGVGGGLILDGKPYRGAIGAGAELGHIVLQYGGPKCGPGCDGHGHFETLVSGRAADRAAQKLYGPSSSARELVDRARDGDEAAAAALAEVGHKLGAGIATLINIFEPELVVLGGGFAEAGDLLFDAARETVAQEALPPGRDLVRIVPAQLGPRAGMVGAGLIAFERLERE